MALQVLQGKVTPEVFNQFKLAQDNADCDTYCQFIEMLLEAYLNPKVKNVEVPRPTAEQLQEIQLKDNEIGRLMLDIDFKQKDIETLRAENLELKVEKENGNHDQGIQLGENQVILTIPPVIAHVLKVEQEVAKKKSGKEFSLGDILLNNFWESIVNGASYPFRIWNRSELSKLVKDLKEKE